MVGFSAGEEYVFGGLVANPMDGQSYLAKMEEGAQGNWLFTLPYTHETGNGQPIYFFYLLLGHIEAWTTIPNVVLFHIARVLSGIFLVITLYYLIKKTRISHTDISPLLILALGSGIGWMILPWTNAIPVDFYVAEMYPFLASYTNPHFPLGLGLMIWIIIRAIEYRSWKDFVFIWITGLLLSSILQFAAVLVIIILAIYFLFIYRIEKKFIYKPILALFTGGGIWIGIQFLIIKFDPLLSLWDQQNITTAPDFLTLMLGISPFILIILPILIIKHRELTFNHYQVVFLIWLVLGLALTYVPVNLQRRFLTGLYIPLIIAFFSLLDIWAINKKLKKRIILFSFFLSIISNVIILAMGLSIMEKKDSLFFLKKNEYQGLVWIRDNSRIQDVVLASPEISLYIPSIAGRRVVYAHPYETLNAEKQKEQVETFYKGEIKNGELDKFIKSNNIRYVFNGPRERTTGNLIVDERWKIAYEYEDIQIYDTAP